MSYLPPPPPPDDAAAGAPAGSIRGGNPLLKRLMIAGYCVAAFALIAAVVAIYTQDRKVSDTPTQTAISSTPTSEPAPSPSSALAATTATTVPADNPGDYSVNDNQQGTDFWQINYSGSWQYAADNPGNYQSDLHVSTAADSVAKMSFIGSGVKIYGAKGSDGGTAQVFLDEELVATVQAYSDQTMKGQLLFASNSLTPGAHRVELKATGQTGPGNGMAVSVDRFVVNTTGTDNVFPTQPSDSAGTQTSAPTPTDDGWDSHSDDTGDDNWDYGSDHNGEGGSDHNGNDRGKKWWKDREH